jgi:hypothetical protein
MTHNIDLITLMENLALSSVFLETLARYSKAILMPYDQIIHACQEDIFS